MIKTKLCVAVFVVAFLGGASCRIYTKCGLLEELEKMQFPRSYARQWVCVVESESQRNTSKVTKRADGSTSYGLFQINSKVWCSIGKKGGKCQSNCEDYLNEDIKDDSLCARKIFDQLGFDGWEGWKRACKGRQAVYQYRC